MIELGDHLKASPPTKGACDVCECPLANVVCLKVELKIFLKAFSKHVCLDCSEKVVELVNLRIRQARNRNFET